MTGARLVAGLQFVDVALVSVALASQQQTKFLNESFRGCAIASVCGFCNVSETVERLHHPRSCNYDQLRPRRQAEQISS